MVFKKRAELNGEVDPNINTKGRIKNDEFKSKRSIKDKELLSLLRKIKPHVSESIATAASIMRNKEASHVNQLKSAVILLNAYRELTMDLYDSDDEDEEGEEIQPQQTASIFSLKMVGQDTPEE